MSAYVKKKLVNLRIDFAFKRLFGVEGNEDILIGFLNAVLQSSINEEITSLHLDDPHLPREQKDDKLSILDLRATLNSGIKINIEIQVRDKKDMIERSLFYWSGMYYSQMTQGMKYTELRPTICINIVDFILFPEEKDFHNVNTVMNRKSKRIITENMQLHFLEIPKVIQEWKEERVDPWEDILARWLLLFPAYENEKLTTILEGIAMEKDPVLKKAIEDWERLSSDKDFLRLYEAREKAIKDRISEIETAEEKAAEKAAKKATEEATIATKIEMIHNMIKMELPIEQIAKVAGLSVEEVNEILQK
ncbi:Rpn family recombination-promoting nuclease/putative transposase [Bacillus mycoides]|uniref:Rpn family recombination-promoting nuclease/putative transposase n=1 Tax=Bacillus mycoides TaxID=1405 RepID=UPI001C016D75|nr:Rpn family recombination-promoting nuclease/putative transposase [Bacillus mycoides]MCQ6535945.1 Rpn family recombination-promoting nuclease/putative transposase [Bacillus mycoides]QWH53984.1 Rpn family recombination-promoting nuclease/putative transposase [Bacillus mycoides]QWI14190.1 Rpn family recombination-promoting nuclease/putative transposase [Bacillus mycoides]QWI57823.1 Rpn family recombination-promoting nuclease/putative transposase [Bacillus mycoides]QWI92827.1 Rpn family recombi